MRTTAKRPVCRTHGRRLTRPLTHDGAAADLLSHREELKAALSLKPEHAQGAQRQAWNEQAERCRRALHDYTAALVRGPQCLCEWDQLDALSWLLGKETKKLRATTIRINSATDTEPA